MLAQALQHDVPHLTRVKGVDYFRRGAVLTVTKSGRGAVAVVRGTRDYHVSIEHESGGFAATCECPYFTDRGEICKHIWAVVVTPETETILAANGPLPRRAWIDPALPDDDYGAGEEREAPIEAWQHFLGEVRRGIVSVDFDVRPSVGQIVYVIDVPGSGAFGNGARVSILSRTRRRDNEWGRPKPIGLSAHDMKRIGDEADREVFSLLRGGEPAQHAGFQPAYAASFTYQIGDDLQRRVLPLMVRTGRALLAPARDAALVSLTMDEGDEWRFELEVSRQPGRGGYSVDGVLRRGEETMTVSDVELVLRGGFLFTRSTMARLRIDNQLSWLIQLRHAGPIVVPASGAASLVETLARSGSDPQRVPEELRYEVESGVPRPTVLIRRQPQTFAYGRENLLASVSFEYSGTVTGGSEPTAFDAARRRLVLRDSAAEQAAFDRLAELGFRKQWNPAEGRQALGIPADRFPAAVRTLVSDGWRVEAEGRLFRAPRDTQLEVRSGIDWFELHGSVDFGDGMSASLPELLAAVQRGDGTLLLEDGTRGLVPEEWLRRVAGAARYGETEGDHVRYRASQAALLDALLASQPAVALDEVFARARSALENFAGVGPLDPPPTFQGHLREYQREALGWLEFLRRFGFGGCLADDMGLGKTVMVLAMLEARRTVSSDNRRPSLVVVPRSLVFNWREEARRFAPEMRVLDYTGTERSTAAVDDHDLVLTTYGTLRRDAAQLKDVEFDYVILDEAQAIKNATTASAKAARLLRGGHRLALSGTPIENHIGELWSLFDFLNPGLLGSAAAFQRTAGRTRLDPEELALVARAVRPFILRRTKAQVAPELPERSEQTIHCELEAAQRKHYDELRTHYRRTLFAYVDRHGMAKSRLQVLEALLRLRQAACHPGLVDPKRAGDPSAKFDVLLPQLQEVAEEGHKALVFSQFTSLLALLRPHLDDLGVKYEYLDGKTRDRAERVERFQTDPECPLFLISLKAGGLGLNLTAAEYVFLLDPWWNPAAEAQAIDRAHRIGQTRHVIAYRLIAKDTVEEKVAALQETKRELADAILAADAGLVRSLSREDLEWLVT